MHLLHRARPLAALILSGGLLVACGDSATDVDPYVTDYPRLSIQTQRLPEAVASKVYKAGIDAVGGDQSYRWQIVNGRLPAGLSLTTEDVPPDDAVWIRGWPREEGDFDVTIRVYSGDGQSAMHFYHLHVKPYPRP